jgi:spermidine synthase
MTDPTKGPRPQVLFGIVLVIATSGLVYELCMAAVASYLLGDTVQQFSLVIGVYLSALGLGAYLSRFVGRRLALTFIDVELGAALIGGLSAELLITAFNYVGAWSLLFYAFVGAVGTLVGLELPLLIRALERRLAFKDLIAKALTFDYAGSLLGSLAFCLILVPKLGLMKSSLASGLANAAVALVSTWALADLEGVENKALRRARIRCVAVISVLVAAWLASDRLSSLANTAEHPGHVRYAGQSAYQRIVVSENADELRLFLNGHLQFSSRDEARYHEALVLPALELARKPTSILIGGGGDGLAAREALRFPGVERVLLVDLDPAVTALFATDPKLRALNGDSLNDPKVRVVNQDAATFLRETEATYDVLIFDFPDPTTYALGKLYSLEFYRTLEARLNDGGVVAVQATSPLFAREAYWCVVETLEAAGLNTLPYRAFVPSFGDWGFVLAGRQPLSPPSRVRVPDPRYLNPEILSSLFSMPPDSSRLRTRVNRIDNQALVTYYTANWGRWNRGL